jgi:hypothetical protein
MFLLDVFAAAAGGRLPPQDGRAEVHSGLPGKAAAALGLLPAGYRPIGGEVLLPGRVTRQA